MSPPSWSEKNLGGLVDFFDHQRIPLSGTVRQGRQGPYPYYGASGIIDHIDDYIFDGRYLLVAEDGENLRSRKTPIAFFADGKFWVNNHAHIIRAKDGEADDYFLKAWLDNADISGYITGAAQPKLSQENLKRIKLCIPKIGTQRKIAAILSAYDDLIENNTRRIKILEEMAQMIYREWFVNFRFPGHENVKMVESELGMIPEGWVVKKFGDVVELVREGINPSKFADETFAHLSIPAFDEDAMPVLERGETIKSGKYLVPSDCILLSKINPRIPRIWLPFLDDFVHAIASTEFLPLVSRPPLSRFFVFALISTPEFLGEFAGRALGTSTSHQRVKPEDFLNMQVIVPSEPLARNYADSAEPLFTLVHKLRVKNTNLRRTRDLLLPRLISGEIDVGNFDIDTGEVPA